MTKPDQTVFIAWHTEQPMARWAAVARLDCIHSAFTKPLYRFAYTQGAKSIEGFVPFSGMEDLEQVYESNSLFPVLKNRLLPETRPEYRRFLEWNGFNPDDPPEPLLLLARSEGIRKTDAIEVFPKPVPDSHGCFRNFFFVHGIRYQPNSTGIISELRSGDRLTLRPEPANSIDENAVAIDVKGHSIGYAPRYLARDIARLMRECPSETVKLVVQQVNHDAPLQQRLLCRLEACWPAEFQPCDSLDYEPIAKLIDKSLEKLVDVGP